MNPTDLGIIIIENYINEAEERELLSLVDLYPGNNRTSPNQPSRMIRFGDFTFTETLKNDTKAAEHGYKGPRRSYGTMNDGIDVAVKDVPTIMTTLGERLVKDKFLEFTPPIYIINKYNPGVGIGRHIDHFDNGPVIPVIGFNSNATMNFTLGKKLLKFNFPRRALFVISGPSRYEWFHSISPVKELRYSLVFRRLQA